MLTHPLVICVHPETANNTVELPPTRGLFRVDSACNAPTICDSAPETQINLSGLVVDDGRRLCIDVCLVDADLVVLLDDLGGSISIRGYPLSSPTIPCVVPQLRLSGRWHCRRRLGSGVLGRRHYLTKQRAISQTRLFGKSATTGEAVHRLHRR